MRKIIKFIIILWQLPQIIIGRLFKSHDDKFCLSFNGVDYYIMDRIEGISLGDRIFLNPNTYEGTKILRHEFGHVIQSRILGWLYVPVILIPSFLWYCLICFIETHFNISNDKIVDIYYRFYPEKWANKLVRKKS